MGNKFKWILILILILILFAGILSYVPLFGQEQLELNNTNISIPEGYKNGGLNKIQHATITNGTHSVYIGELDNTGNIENYVNNYINQTIESNYTPLASNLTLDNVFVYKVVNKEVGGAHYWFKINDKIYTIYTWAPNPNLDSIVLSLIKSINEN